MRSFLKLTLLILVLPVFINAQSVNPENIPYRYWIYFKDKGDHKPGFPLMKGSAGYDLAVSALTPKALWRRGKVLPQDKIIRYEDLPVSESYIQQINKAGYTHRSVSKWMNAVTVLVTKKDLQKILKMPFVLKAEGVGVLYFPEFKTEQAKKNYSPLQKGKNKYDYGLSLWQYEQINVTKLHNYGVTGLGVTVGMCDDGFNWRNQVSLRDRRVKGEFDWVMRDDSTQYQEPEDDWDQDGHGTATMSCLGGFYEGEIVGPAFDAEFYLSKTEDNVTETPVEEDYWLESVEWMESQGVEIISSSLIYKPFDDPNNDYTYKDMDGNTTVIARAGDMAAYLGVVVLNSMGNERQTDPPSIVSPPDGDSVIAVGAVDSAGVIASFSSNGPTSDGRIKPDVVAMGEWVYAATSMTVSLDDSSFSHTSGTSFSCPITAGVTAQILSVHPELTAMEVRDALKNTADRSNKPDNIYGWGLVNALDAALYHGSFFSSTPEVSFKNNELNITVYFVTKDIAGAENAVLHISFDGSTFTDINMTRESLIGDKYAVRYNARLPVNGSSVFAKFYFSSFENNARILSPFKAPENFFIFRNDSPLELVINY